MNHIEGSAVEIFCEIPSNKVDDTTLTLESLKDPDGNDYSSSESLSFSEVAGQTNVASVVWQSVKNTHQVGRYAFIIKAVNGARENFGKGHFYLTPED